LLAKDATSSDLLPILPIPHWKVLVKRALKAFLSRNIMDFRISKQLLNPESVFFLYNDPEFATLVPDDVLCIEDCEYRVVNSKLPVTALRSSKDAQKIGSITYLKKNSFGYSKYK
jgi:hypothetical protein